jgi:uncharacterized repeat protein (TIGR01451 family)
LLAYNETTLLTETVTISPTLIISNVVVPGQTDLNFLSYSFETDLSLDEFTISPESVIVSNTAQITITLSNIGDRTVISPTVNIYLLPDIGNASLFHTISDPDPLPGGASKIYNISWQAPDEAGNYYLYATADPDNLLNEEEESNNSKSVQIAVITNDPTALSLYKDDGGITVEPGDVLTYTLTYANSGGLSSGVILTETVPLFTTFNPAASTAGWSCLPDNTAGSICTLTVGTVAAGDDGSVNFVLDVDNPLAPNVTQLENTAIIGDDGSNGPDQNPADNTATDTTPVNSFYGGDLSGNEALTGTPGTTVTYTVVITNTGNNDDFFDLTIGGNNWPATLSQTTVGLAAGTSATFQVVVEIPEGAGDGESDVVTVTVTSQGEESQSDTASLTTTAEVEMDGYQLFMPVVIRQTGARPD